MKRVAVAGVIGTLTLVAVGCGGASTTSSTTPTAAATAVPTATPTPSPTVDPIAAAAQFYVATANAYNTAEDIVTKEEPANTLYTKLAVTERKDLAANEAFQKAIYSYTWPMSVQSQITSLASDVQGEIQAIETFIAQPNAPNWNALLASGSTASDGAAAVRLALHLPPVSS